MRKAVVAIFGAVLLIVAGIAGGITWGLARVTLHPALLIQHADGNLVVQDSRGRLRPLTTDADGRGRIYAYPVPAPDERSVAYVATVHGTTAVSSSLVVQSLEGDRRTVFDSSTSHPFYLHWSPDSGQIAFLASDTAASMLLRTVNTSGDPAPQQVVPGDPSYFAWTPDSKRLLLHTGGHAPGGYLSLWGFGDKAPRKFQAAPALFQAPAWLADGHTAIAVIAGDDGVALVRLSEDGKVQQRLARTDTGMLFTVAPDSKQIAYVPVEGRSLGNLHIVGVDGKGEREIQTGLAVAFWWAPDSKRIAYITLPKDDGPSTIALRTQEQPPTLFWNVLEMESGQTRALKRFVPSAPFFNVLPYFDQYAQSIRVWDRMGRRLVYADETGVWTLDVRDGTTTKIDQGVLAMWIER
jgi:hypothetical protein